MPRGIYKRLKQYKRSKQGEANRLKMIRRGENHPMYGKEQTLEVKEKMSKAHIGKKHCQATKDKISKANKGKPPPPYSKETSRKRLETRIKNGWWKNPELAKKRISEGNKGKKASKESRKKMSEAQRGEKSHNWRGGISFEPYSVDWTKTLRRSIRERDHYVCQFCGKPQSDRALSVHHIDYNKKNCNPNNLITLCDKCHRKTNYNRKYWTQFCSDIMD